MDISNDEKLLEWFESIEAAQSTRRIYHDFMKMFCECVEKTPTELIQESIRELKQGLLSVERKSNSYIAKFKKTMNDKGYAPKTFNTGMATIRSFYRNFDIQLSSSTTKIKKALPRPENETFLKREDVIRLVTNVTNLRQKAIILCMVTSGMARQEIINLKIKNITFDENNIGIVSVRRQKSQTDYVTFISPEASIALKNYWDERSRNPKTKIEFPEDYAFVTYHKSEHGVRATKLSEITFVVLFNLMGNKLGFENGDGYIKSRSHALRKFFSSTLANAGMPKDKIDFMLGHSLSGTDRAYFNNMNIEELKKLYIKYIAYLKIEKSIEIRSLDTQDAKKLEELEIRNSQLEKQLEQKDAVVEVLKERMDAFEGNYEYFEGYMKEFYKNNRPPGLMPVKPVQLKDLKKSRSALQGK